MTMTRPTFTGAPTTWNYGVNKTLSFKVGTLGAGLGNSTCYVALMDLGYSTHGVHSMYYLLGVK